MLRLMIGSLIASSAKRALANSHVRVLSNGVATMPIRVRPSAARGHANHGWLDSYHTFSFADYYEPEFESFGALRVINEDTVAGGSGFPTHGHANANIFSYILSGSLRHTDSMGNTEVLRPGDVQYTEAGTGIRHAEYNAHATEPVRFLQIWVKPWRSGLTPRYATGHFPSAAKTNAMLPLLSPSAPGEEAAPKTPTLPGSLPMAADVAVFASRLEHGASVAHTFAAPGRRGYVHVPIAAATKGLTVAAVGGCEDGASVTLGPGDGAFIDGGLAGVRFTAATAGGAGAGDAVEFVFFDLQ